MPRRNPGLVDPQIVVEIMQMPPDVKRRLLGHATRRTHDYRCGLSRCQRRGEHLLADAIADTLTGTVIWVRRVPLSYRLRSVVRVRTSNHIECARRRSRHSSVNHGAAGHATTDHHLFCVS
jgi:hypothetical protein